MREIVKGSDVINEEMFPYIWQNALAWSYILGNPSLYVTSFLHPIPSTFPY
jgi:hypothetical protein